MIDTLDEAIRTLIRRDALNGADVEVVFDAPNREWAARQNSPAIDVYLYDIREDMKWRAYGTVDSRDASSGHVTARHPPPRHFKFSYLVTAWTQRPEDEHRLLSAVLGCFLRFDMLPTDVLTGPLEDVKPVPVSIGMPPPDDRSVSDVWTALGGELKPSLDLAITAPIDPRRTVDVAPLVLEEPRLTLSADEAREARARRRPARPRASVVQPVAVEEVVAGTEDQPGRRIRIKNNAEP